MFLIEIEDLVNKNANVFIRFKFSLRVNEVGVDINKALTHSHTANLLQFVCGLGPRKAQFIIRTLKTNKQNLENRSQLVHICQMGPKVFMNSAGIFLVPFLMISAYR